MSKHELATKADAMPLRNMDDLARLAEMFAKSGYFTDARDAAQVGVKVLAGREMGFGAFASVNGVHIIQGRPAMGANLMAAAVKASGKYDYRVRTMEDDVVEIEYFQGGESLGVSRFDAEDAKAAGTKNLGKFPRNMLFARAMSNGVRWYCPDVFMGSAVYTPEELGGVDDEPIDVQARAEPAAKAEPAEAPTPEPEARSEAPAKPERKLGPAKAADLDKALVERGVPKPLEFARLATGRDDLATLADLTVSESREVFAMSEGGDPFLEPGAEELDAEAAS